MAELDELKGLDELFETREVLQNKGNLAIITLQKVVSDEKLSGEFYPALNTFMIDFVDKFSLGKKLSEVPLYDISDYVKLVLNNEEKLEMDKIAGEIKQIICPYIHGLIKMGVAPKLVHHNLGVLNIQESNSNIFTYTDLKIIQSNVMILLRYLIGGKRHPLFTHINFINHKDGLYLYIRDICEPSTHHIKEAKFKNFEIINYHTYIKLYEFKD
jgi:hypothetical protein